MHPSATPAAENKPPLRHWSRHPLPPLSKRQLANLKTGVFIATVWPQVAFRDCGVCTAVQYDERSGGPLLDARKQLQSRFNERLCDLPRADGETACPRHSPQRDRGLTPENREVFGLYQHYAAAGEIPRHDPHFNLAVAVIQEAESAGREYVRRRATARAA